MNAETPAAPLPAEWTPLAPLTGGGASGSPGGTHPVVADGETAHVVWKQGERGEIYYRRSEDGGVSWGDAVQLTSSGAAEYPCSLELSGSVLHLIWPDGRPVGRDRQMAGRRGNGPWEVYYKRSTDGGDTWGEDTRLTPGVDLFRMGTAISGSAVHVAWGTKTDTPRTPQGYVHTWGEIYYKRSTDGGATWEEDLRLTVPDISAMRPGIAASGDYVHLIWFDKRDSKELFDWNIYYKRSTDGGKTWGPIVRMNDTPEHSRHPQLVAAPGGRVCCIWEDGSFYDGTKWAGDAALYTSLSEDNGETWTEPKRITFINAPNGLTTHPKSYAYGSRVHLAWTDTPEGAGRPQAAYYMTSPDGGATWEEPERLTFASDGPRLVHTVGGTEAYAIVLIGKADTLYYRRRGMSGT